MNEDSGPRPPSERFHAPNDLHEGSDGEPARTGGGTSDAAPAGKFGALLHHFVALILFTAAAFFTLWFLETNTSLWRVFPSLKREFALGEGAFDWTAFAWGAGAVAVFLILGWFFLETVEVYIPRAPMACLAFILGMGMAGFIFELLAMAHWLTRPLIFIFPGLLILILWPFAIFSGRRRPETGEGGEGGPVEQMMRRGMAREAYAKTLIRPATFGARLFQILAFSLIAIISLLIFYHALLYPETYWDSLILYLGYARMMFYEGGIVRKVMGQVGIGLGANYPHLYSLLGVAASLAAKEWSELPQRLIAPMAGLASTILVYHTVLRLTRHINFSLAMTLLYRSIPLGIAYDQYASDYALTILFAAAFLYVALLYIETALTGYFIIASALIAFSMHLNYLMGILWLPWGLMVIGAHVGLPHPSDEEKERLQRERIQAAQSPVQLAGWDDGVDKDAAWTQHRYRKGLFQFLLSPVFVMTLLACALVGSTWFIRNEIVTGNPVYAFFPKIFGGVNLNQDVMDSAAKEWSGNGGGIAMLGDDVETRIRNSWIYFVGGAAEKGGHYHEIFPLAYRLQPFFVGFALMGAVLLLARAFAAPLTYGPGRRFADFGLRFGVAAFALALGLFAFHYKLAPYYLYQIILVLPALAVLASFSFPYWRLPFWRTLFGALVLLIGLVPGVAMGLMGFKVFGPVSIGPDRAEVPQDLVVFRNPLPDPERFYRWRYGDDPLMWRYMNQNLKSHRILTHENRHLVFDPSIELVHLDDWAVQHLWDQTPNHQIETLKKLGVYYYLRVPNERNHEVNARLGTDEWIQLGLVELVHAEGENLLYRLK